jgi:hypothetical protein
MKNEAALVISHGASEPHTNNSRFQSEFEWVPGKDSDTKRRTCAT